MFDPIAEWFVEKASQIWPLSGFWLALLLLMALVLSAHAALYKRDSRSAAGWIGLIWLSPVIGSFLYLAIGVNRIYRTRVRLRRFRRQRAETPLNLGAEASATLLEGATPLVRAGDRIAEHPLLGGNQLTALLSGEQAYPAMIQAIREAHSSIGLMTYIFNRDDTGREFTDALAAAVRRGVEVRVLIDGVGADLGLFTIRGLLRRNKIPHAVFLPARIATGMRKVNLRNHRKLLTIDGRIAFTGGMNLTEECRLDRSPSHPVSDIHFQIEGPLVADLQATFADDWYYMTQESLDAAIWFPRLKKKGPTCARVIVDGPDQERPRLAWLLLAAIAEARESITIVTPYFLPERSIQAALGAAALRGIQVHLLLPSRSDARIVDWASRRILPYLHALGVKITETSPPFEHSKFVVIDQRWVCLGSSNWDARGFRLNFELNIEAWDPPLASRLQQYAALLQERGYSWPAHPISKESIGVRLRNSVAWLFSPYL